MLVHVTANGTQRGDRFLVTTTHHHYPLPLLLRGVIPTPGHPGG